MYHTSRNPCYLLVQWLKVKVGDRGLVPRSGFQVAKKQNVSSLLTREYSVLCGASMNERKTARVFSFISPSSEGSPGPI